MKNILLISLELPPQIGGAGVVGLQTARSLTQIGHKVTVVTRPENMVALSEKYPQIQFLAVKTHKFIRPFEIWLRVRRLLAEYDLIILNDGVAKRFGAYCLSDAQLEKTVLFLQGQEVSEIIENPNMKLRLGGYREKFLSLLQKSGFIVAVSQSMRREFLELEVCRSFSSKIEVIYNGYDPKVFRRVATTVRKDFNLPEEADVLISVSRIVKEKGYEKMLAIFAHLHQIGCVYYWLVVGSGDFLEELKEKAARIGVAEFICFTGGVEQDELPYYLSGANVFWLLSEYYESLGNVYFEANACGIPSVGPQRGGVVEAIENGVTGYLVECDDECIQIFREKRWRSCDAKNFALHLQKFDLNISLLSSQFLYGNESKKI